MKKKKQTKLLNMKGFLSFLILHEIRREKLCGDELAEKIGKRKSSKLTAGTIYPTLKRLKRLKLVQYRRKGRKKSYFLTEKGKVTLNNAYKEFSRLFYGLKSKIKRNA